MDKKLICFDLDGTLISTSSWVHINALLGITAEEDHDLFHQYLKGTLQYAAWTKALVELYKRKGGVTKSELVNLADSLALRDDAMQAITDAKSKGYTVLLISGSIDVVVETIANKVQADAWLACNRAVFNEEGILEDIISVGDESPHKLELVSAYCKEHDINLKEVITVGDGGNDLLLFKNAKGIVLGENAELGAVAWKKISALSEVKDLI